ncbi:hypothetical protein PENSPDRAFT_547233, partial [Peniophora sp. CONT]
WRLPGIPLAHASQKLLYRLILRNKQSKLRMQSLTMLDCARHAAYENNGEFPSDRDLWTTTWSNNLHRKDQEFMWKLFHNAYKVGEYWERMDDPDLQNRKFCGACGDECESMRHILTECEAPGQAEVWEEAKSLWSHKGSGEWPAGDALGVILASGLIRCHTQESRDPGAERLLAIIISTACRCIWNARCERAIPKEDGTQGRQITADEAKARWWKAITARLELDQAMTHQRFDKLALKPALVRMTWRNLLENEAELPDNWI